MDNNIKVASFNVRVHCERDGINAFFNRKDFLLEGIAGIDADIYGFQEVTTEMGNALKQGMKDYTFIGMGRSKEYADEHTYIAFKTDKFDVYSVENFWLSETPDVPGSIFTLDQSNCPRICTSVGLIHKESGKIIRHYNTHLDHKGKDARLKGIKVILKKAEVDKFPVVITGDFNCTPEEAPVLEVLDSDLKLSDATADFDITFTGFGLCEELKIDYIFTNLKFKDSYKVRKITDDGMYLSDHDAVVTTLILGD